MSSANSSKKTKSQDGSGGQLLIVATPIGNLGDITLRALEALKSADLIACEDTRTTAKLLAHYGIKAPTFAYHEHNEAAATPRLIERLRLGQHIALVSDAGTPLLSDPGSRLVRAAIEAGITVTPLPGASALLAALTIAGLDTAQFYFAGFLPQKTKAQQGLFAQLKNIPATLIFYEAPHRLVETLVLLGENFGERNAAVARELTKLYEECRRAPLNELAEHYRNNPPKGECVILVEAAPERAELSEQDIDAALRAALSRLSVKQAVEEVTALSGKPRRSIYQRALELAK